MNVFARKPVEITSATAVEAMQAPLAQARDGTKIDGRSLRATGRNIQFNNKISDAAHAAFKRAQVRSGIRMNELLESMIRFWVEKHEGVPEAEKDHGRTLALTIYGNAELIPGLEILAEKRGTSIHGVIEELVAVRIEQLRKAGQLPQIK